MRPALRLDLERPGGPHLVRPRRDARRTLRAIEGSSSRAGAAPFRRGAAIAVILLMAVGSVFLWIGVPAGWLLIASRVTDSSAPSMGPYVLVLVGVPVTMVIVARFLSRLNALYERLTGGSAEVRVQAPWLRSMRGERAPARPRTMLDVVMVVSVGLAAVTFLIWFLFFAGSSLPTG
jgi:hypothetical protein